MAFSTPLPSTTGGDLNAVGWTTGTAVPPAGTPLNKPTNLADGDGLFFLAYDQIAASTVTTPTGFAAQYHATATSTRGFYLFGKQIPSAAGETATSYSTTDSNSGRGLAAVFRVPGVNQTTLLDAAPGSDIYSSSAVSSLAIPGVTATNADSLHMICVFANGTGAVTHTFSATGYTVLFTVNVNNGGSTSSMAVLYKKLSASGATGSVTVTMTPSDSVTNPASSGGFSIAEAGSPAATSGSATVTLSATGTGTQTGGGSATLTLSGTGAGTPAGTSGSATITLQGKGTTPAQTWVATKSGGRQYIGHRDGDWATYGEETRAGYTATSAYHSQVALEVSFWVTTDGVYVASHDQTTGRVFSGTSVDITTVTWASISSKTTLVGGYPIATVDQIIADNPGRIFVLENKANVSNATRAAYLDALCSGRWISKCFGPSGIGWCNAAAVFGAPAMAYFFPVDLINLTNATSGWTGTTQLIYELADYSSSGSTVPTQANANTFYSYARANSLMTWVSVLGSTANRSTADSQATTAGSVIDGYMMSNVPAIIASDVTSAAAGSATLTLSTPSAISARSAGSATVTLTATTSTVSNAGATSTLTLSGSSSSVVPGAGLATITFLTLTATVTTPAPVTAYYLYKPPSWRNAALMPGSRSLVYGVATSTTVYRLAGVWHNVADAGIDQPRIADVDVDPATGIQLYFNTWTIVPASLHDALAAVSAASTGWTPGVLIPQ